MMQPASCLSSVSEMMSSWHTRKRECQCLISRKSLSQLQTKEHFIGTFSRKNNIYIVDLTAVPPGVLARLNCHGGDTDHCTSEDYKWNVSALRMAQTIVHMTSAQWSGKVVTTKEHKIWVTMSFLPLCIDFHVLSEKDDTNNNEMSFGRGKF